VYERLPIACRGRTVGLDLMLSGACEIDDRVDAVLRHAEFDREVDIALTEEIDERVDSVRRRRAEPVGKAIAVGHVFRSDRLQERRIVGARDAKDALPCVARAAPRAIRRRLRHR